MRRLLLATVLALPLLAAGAATAEQPEAPAHDGHAAAAPAGGEHAAAHEEHHAGTFDGQLVKVVVLQLIAFVLLFLALRKWAFPVIAGALNERASKIRETYEKLDHEKSELQRLTKLAQDKLAGIEQEAAAKVDQAVKEGNAQKAAILAEAQAAAGRIMAKAKTEIEMERAKAVEEIRQEMVRLALEAAERLVKQQLTAAKQEELVERFVAEIEKVKA